MPAELITREELEADAARSGVVGMGPAQYDEAIDRAVDTIRQAALNDYTPASFEALTVSTAPDEMRENALALALHRLTRADGNRPASISDGRDAATRWLGFLAAGKTHYDQSPGAVLVKREVDAVQVTSQTQKKKLRDPWAITR